MLIFMIILKSFEDRLVLLVIGFTRALLSQSGNKLKYFKLENYLRIEMIYGVGRQEWNIISHLFIYSDTETPIKRGLL